MIDLFSLKFTTNPETGTVTVELKKSEEKNEPKTEKEIKVENTLQSLKINFDHVHFVKCNKKKQESVICSFS